MSLNISPSPRHAKRRRAPASGRRLSDSDVALVKAMLMRNLRQHEIAANFGVNGGRISEVATGTSFADVTPASEAELARFLAERRLLI